MDLVRGSGRNGEDKARCRGEGEDPVVRAWSWAEPLGGRVRHWVVGRAQKSLGT